MLSIVIPFYNESGNIPELFRRIDEVLSHHAPDYEVIGVDDGSRDDTFMRLLAERDKNPRLKLVRLSRNFGKEIALSAGLQHASGEAVVTMDADLQHPPELIPQFLAHWRDGYKMVYAARQSARRETWVTMG